jgi:hypothetical protein
MNAINYSPNIRLLVSNLLITNSTNIENMGFFGASYAKPSEKSLAVTL